MKKTLNGNRSGRDWKLSLVFGCLRKLNRSDRGNQRILKIVGFFTDETDFIGIRKTVLDRMPDQGVLCNQKRRDQQESEGFQRSSSL